MSTRLTARRRSRWASSARTLCLSDGFAVDPKGGTVPPPDQRRAYN